MSDERELKNLRDAFPGIWVREDGAFRSEEFGVSWSPGDVEGERCQPGQISSGGLVMFGELRQFRGNPPCELKLSQIQALADYITAIDSSLAAARIRAKREAGEADIAALSPADDPIQQVPDQSSSQASSIDTGQESRDSIAFWAAHPDGTFTQMPPDWKLGDDTQRTAKKVLSIKVVEAGFIPWEGGECEKDYPDDVAYDAWVEVILSGGKIQPPTLASAWDWNRLDNELNIIAYRIIGAPAGEAGALVNQTGDA